MNVRTSIDRRALVATAFALTLLGGCAEGGRNRRDTGPTGGSDAPILGIDAPFVLPDAGSQPDAPVVMPDAVVADAFVPGADAFVGPDAFVPGADAFTPAPDAFTPPIDAFTPPTDAASSCSESPCRILAPQCGCAAGESCYPSGATRVCAVSGTRLEGSGCSGISDCAAGLGCVNFSSSAASPGNMCSRVCSTDADCASGAVCVHTIDDGLGGTVPGLRFCSRVCTPSPSTGCAPNLACTVFRESAGLMRYFTDCAGPVGTGRQGAACVDDTDCAAGFGCADPGTGLQCLSWCRVASPSCPIGTTCLGFGAIVSGVEWGLCG
jgi:hypothetical protein